MNTIRRSLTIWGAAMAMGACVPDKPRLNSPPQGEAELRHPMTEYYAYHNDQGMLEDMSLADIHFVAHQPELSGAGEARLARYAELLATCGGELHYESAHPDKNLIEARIERASEFLKRAVPNAQTISVVAGPALGRGMTAKEASLAKGVAKQPEPRKAAYHLKYFADESGK